MVEVSPLVPEKAWDWFCLDGIPYHCRILRVLWDRSGRKFIRGRGLRLLDAGCGSLGGLESEPRCQALLKRMELL